MKNLVILGSSGSIGQNALWIADRYPEELKIFGLSVHSNTAVLGEQIKRYHPSFVCISDETAASIFASDARALGVEMLKGESGLETLASHKDGDIVLNAVVGFAGLRSTLAAAKAGKRIALANKESMVAGGELVNQTIRLGGGEIIPVDSEHSAIFQCLKGSRNEDIRRLILTSSGGPFRNYLPENFASITVEQALNHPTWKMGKKVTIDSATLMNKGLEIIEAVYLFGLPQEKIDVVINPQSIIHSMVEHVDGSIIAQISRPDMRLPIEYALFYPQRRNLTMANLDFSIPFTLDFQPPDEIRFPSLGLARRALALGGSAPAIFNAANEVAVEAFIERRISLTDIFAVVDSVLKNAQISDSKSLDYIITADNLGRKLALEFVRNRSI